MTTPAESRPDRPPASLREGLAIGGVLLAVLVAGIWWVSSPVAPVEPLPGIDRDYANYVGDAACGSCHPGEAATQSRSGHARTLRTIDRSSMARKLDGQRIEDPERPGVFWSFALRDGRMVVERNEAGQVERSRIEYAFGSGNHASTFIALVDRDPMHPKAFEQRISYFGHTDALGLTPGLSLAGHAAGNSPGGCIHSASETLRCFDCHATVISNRGPTVLDETTMISNVSCERCHGPARSHVEAARNGGVGESLRMRQGPGRWTAAEQLRQCGECHRTPEMVKPGSIRVDNPSMVRHQPVGLAQSACYLKSEGHLSCVTCHDPHARTSRDRLAYEAACLSCHKNQPSETVCTVNPSTGCLDCHMPRREVSRGMRMTDHWIRRNP